MKRILINADDFGWSESCSRAILESMRKGYITTTTACVNGDFFDEAVKMVIDQGCQNQVGIHLNITEGVALTDDMKRFDDFYEDGHFNHKFSRTKPLSREKQMAVYNELTEQVLRFKESGLKIHHADSHNHIHNSPNIFSIFMRVMREQEISDVRIFRNIGDIPWTKKVIKSLYNSYLKRHTYAYSDFFGSYEDFCFLNNKNINQLEMMIHPDYEKKQLVDRNPTADYESPYGLPLENMIANIRKKGYEILKL